MCHAPARGRAVEASHSGSHDPNLSAHLMNQAVEGDSLFQPVAPKFSQLAYNSMLHGFPSGRQEIKLVVHSMNH
jgi:hypothetical protein